MREIVFFRTVTSTLTVAVDSEGTIGLIPAPGDIAFHPIPDPDTLHRMLLMCSAYVHSWRETLDRGDTHRYENEVEIT